VRGVAATLACFALIAALLAWSRWLARRRLASLGHASLAAACLALATFLWVVAEGLASFSTLRPGVAIAELRFDEVGPGRYRATLVRLPDGRIQVFEMPGERWRVEARTLAWLGPAASLGMQPSYRLERFESGPVVEPTAQAAARPSYALAEDAGVDLWSQVRGNRLWARYARAEALETQWQPMSSGAEFSITALNGRLVVAPAEAANPVLAPRSR
jgi:hypothetical protein